MNNLHVPPTPNWYQTKILACAPDNTLIYGAKNDVVVILVNGKDEPHTVKIFEKAHTGKVVSVDVNINWGEPNKWAISAGEDHVVILWDLINFTKITSFDSLTPVKDKILGSRFLTDDRILTVTEYGIMEMSHPSTNTSRRLNFYFNQRTNILCFEPCPHAPHIIAFGAKHGIVIIANLKKTGKLAHYLRGHTSDVISLSWCPVPFNIFPSKPNNYIKGTSPIKQINETNDIKESKEIEVATNEDKDKEESPSKCVEESTVTKDDTPSQNVEESTVTKDDTTSQNVEESTVTKDDTPPQNVEESAVTKDDTPSQSVEESTVTKDETTSPSSSQSVTTVPIEEEPRQEYLLASSGKDSAIYIWRAGTDCRMQTFFKVSDKKFQRHNKHNVDHIKWILVKWITPFSLITGSKCGQLLKFTVPKPLDQKKQYTFVHSDHTAFIFSMAGYAPILNQENWLNNYDNKIWTFSHDMFLLNTKLDKTATHECYFETSPFVIHFLASSPLDPSRIAMGLSNGNIKIWNSSHCHLKNFTTSSYEFNLRSKIGYLCWHPKNELLLAFCSEEGSIGYINTNIHNRAKWFKQYFSSKVHKIEWGPYKNDKIHLYATSNNDLVCLNPEELKNEPIQIELPKDIKVYTFSWKSDYEYLLLISLDGQIVILNKDLTLKAKYYQKKKLSTIVWCPDTSKSLYLAGALDKNIIIYNFDEINEKNGTLNVNDVIKVTLNGHLSNVKYLSWSPFDSNKIVSAGEDNIAIVWNIEKKEIISSYYGPNFDFIRSIIWSPVNEDYIICTLQNTTLNVWKYTDYPATLSKDVIEKCKQRMKKEKHVTAQTKVKKQGKSIILANTNVPDTDDRIDTKIQSLRDLVKSKENGFKDTGGCPDIKKIFGLKDDVVGLLETSEKAHMDKGKYDTAAMIALWRGDLENNIKEAIEQKKVTPLIITLAPSVSISMWQKACETYALQEEDKITGQGLEIATYFLCAQNIEKAIQVLLEKEMYKEALTIAKCKLPPDSVIINKILEKWGKYCCFSGAFEIAAQCFIVLGKYYDAARQLFRRSDVRIIKFSLELAKKSDDDDLIKAIEFRLNEIDNQNRNTNYPYIQTDNLPSSDEEVERKPKTKENGNKFNIPVFEGLVHEPYEHDEKFQLPNLFDEPYWNESEPENDETKEISVEKIVADEEEQATETPNSVENDVKESVKESPLIEEDAEDNTKREKSAETCDITENESVEPQLIEENTENNTKPEQSTESTQNKDNDVKEALLIKENNTEKKEQSTETPDSIKDNVKVSIIIEEDLENNTGIAIVIDKIE